ncbi:ADP-ribosylation factor GTPase-activating protein AGD7 [Cucumispora dikerogammari]|nr:ADP-ribosylation factor GTPase-activating protein AGD7 [Cucumispora dikerogammari]
MESQSSNNININKLTDLKALYQNQNCFNCQEKFPDWADIYYGIFICRTCAGRHRGFGTKISRIMSTVIDKWTDRQVYIMENGNKSLSEYINNNSTVLLKYRNNKQLTVDPEFFASAEGFKYKEIIQNKANKKFGKPEPQINLDSKNGSKLIGVKMEKTSSGFSFGSDSQQQVPVENNKPFIERSMEKVMNYDYRGSFNTLSGKAVELFHKSTEKIRESAYILSQRFRGVEGTDNNSNTSNNTEAVNSNNSDIISGYNKETEKQNVNIKRKKDDEDSWDN